MPAWRPQLTCLVVQLLLAHFGHGAQGKAVLRQDVAHLQRWAHSRGCCARWQDVHTRAAGGTRASCHTPPPAAAPRIPWAAASLRIRVHHLSIYVFMHHCAASIRASVQQLFVNMVMQYLSCITVLHCYASTLRANLSLCGSAAGVNSCVTCTDLARDIGRPLQQSAQ